jgi:aminopeptidase YwaD
MRLSVFHLVILLSFFALCCTTVQQRTSDSSPQTLVPTKVSGDTILSHIKILAGDDFEGRAPGTRGGNLAADYMKSKFQAYGLTPFPDVPDFFQRFTVTTSLKAGSANRLELTGKAFASGAEFVPAPYASNSRVSATELVFVGYGMTAEKFDDYKQLDVKGKIVVMLFYSPEKDNPHSTFYEHGTLWKKLNLAREKGAVGALVFKGKKHDEDDELTKLTPDRLNADAGIPALHITRKTASTLLKKSETELERLQTDLDTKRVSKSFSVKTSVSLTSEIVREKVETKNIIGYLPGTSLKDETIIIGAHYDHLGYGGTGSGSLAPDEKKIHHGADDNASGSAGLLELARYFGARRDSLKRNLVFMSFGAEEMGLLGSAHYAAHPLFPLDQTVLMLNMDMIGRMKDSALAIHGVGTATQLESICAAANIDSLRLKFSADGYGPSDHSSFYSKNIPVLFFFTGNHANYHKPTDTWEKIKPAEEARVVELVSRIVQRVDAQLWKLTFTKAAADSQAMGRSSGAFKVSFGSIPNYAVEVEGVQLDGVRSGSVAEKAGLQSGDIIIELAGKPVRNIYDYTDLIRSLSPGDTAKVIVKRGAEKLTFTAEFPKKVK